MTELKESKCAQCDSYFKQGDDIWLISWGKVYLGPVKNERQSVTLCGLPCAQRWMEAN